MMAFYTLTTRVVITLHTSVEADDLEDAIKKAKRNKPMAVCSSCIRQSDESAWVISDVLDGDPTTSPLVAVEVNGEKLEDHELKHAMVRW